VHGKRRGGRGRLVALSVILSVLASAGRSAISATDVVWSGSFAGEIELSTGELPDLSRLSLSITARSESWRTSLRATASDGEFFSYLGLSDSRELGPISLQSLLAFDPSEGTFSYVSNLARTEIVGVGVSNYIYVPSQYAQAYDQVTLNGSIGATRWRSVVRSSICPAELETLSFQVDWAWDECDVDLRAFVSVDGETGFDRFRLRAVVREVPALTFGSLATDFSVELEFEPEGKSLVPELRTRSSGSFLCVTPRFAFGVDEDPLIVEGLEVYGITLEGSIEETVDFYAATSMDAAKNLELIGDPDFFEVYRFGIARSGCCEEDVRIEAAFYFENGSTWLSDWGMTTASIDFTLGRDIRWSLGMEVRADAGWVFRAGWDWRF